MPIKSNNGSGIPTPIQIMQFIRPLKSELTHI
jgi:hypothetical protein